MAEQLLINVWVYILVIVAIVCLTALLIFFLHNQRKAKETKPDKKPSPIVSALVASVILGILLIVLVLLTGQTLKPSYLLSVPAFFILIYAIQWNELRKLKPLSDEKLLNKAWEYLYEYSKALPHKGNAYGSPIASFNTIINEKQPEPFNMLRHWLLRARVAEGTTYFYIAQSMTTGQVQKYIEDPDKKIINMFSGKDPAEGYDFEKAFIHESLKPDISVEQNGNDKRLITHDPNEETQTY